MQEIETYLIVTAFPIMFLIDIFGWKFGGMLSLIMLVTLVLLVKIAEVIKG